MTGAYIRVKRNSPSYWPQTDFVAVTDGHDAETDPVGYGATPLEAARDLADHIDFWADVTAQAGAA